MLDGAVLERLSDFQAARVKLKRCGIRYGITLCLACEGARSKKCSFGRRNVSRRFSHFSPLYT